MTEVVVLVEEQWRSLPENVSFARQKAREIVRRFDETMADAVELAVGEACANAVEHGSPHGPDDTFLLRCSLSEAASNLVFEIEDAGDDFALTDATLGCAPDLSSEGGRGLFLMHAVMDEVILHRTPHGLSVRMVKHLPPSTVL